MKKDGQDDLRKSRSSRACIRDGYQFFTANFRRIFRATWIVALGYALLSAVASALPVLISPTLLWAGWLLGALAVILLLLVADKLLHRRGILQPSGKVKLKGWLSRLGGILIIAIVTMFIVSVLTLITSLPTIIMMAANWQSQVGILNGDPAGMPDYVRWMTLAVFLLEGFIQAFVWLSVLFPFHFYKASIAQQEKELKEFNKTRI